MITGSNKVIIKVQNLTKRYGKKCTVNSISFSLYPGQIFGLLGPNGAGKTTIFRMLSNLCPKSSGIVTVNGYSLDKEPQKCLMSMGITIDIPSFYNELSAYDNLFFSAQLYQGIDPARRVAELINLVGLHGRERDKVKTYSTGMRQRLGLARALIGDPILILLDEPANGLDPQGMVDLYRIIGSLAEKEGKTFIVSSHLLHDMEDLCTNVLIINQGSCLAQGKTVDIIKGNSNIIEITSSDLSKLEMICQGIPFVDIIHKTGGRLVIRNNAEDINRIMKGIVDHSIPISSFSVRKRSLEDVFLELTGGDIQ